MLLAAMVAILVSMGLILIRCIAGPTVYDRILAVNAFGTHTVVAIAVLGVITNTVFFLDVALTYGLINFISTVAMLRYFKYKTFSRK